MMQSNVEGTVDIRSAICILMWQLSPVRACPTLLPETACVTYVVVAPWKFTLTVLEIWAEI